MTIAIEQYTMVRTELNQRKPNQTEQHTEILLPLCPARPLSGKGMESPVSSCHSERMFATEDL